MGDDRTAQLPHPEELVDGYTYMIERNKLMIQQARECESREPSAPQPADAESLRRERLMELYSELEPCGRVEWRGSD